VISLVVLDDLLAGEQKFDSNVLVLTSKIFSKNSEEEGKKVIASFYWASILQKQVYPRKQILSITQ